MSEEVELTIHYHHVDCAVEPGVEWEDAWTSAVDDECPACGTTMEAWKWHPVGEDRDCTICRGEPARYRRDGEATLTRDEWVEADARAVHESEHHPDALAGCGLGCWQTAEVAVADAISSGELAEV